MRRTALLVLATALVVLLVGCGGTSTVAPPPDTLPGLYRVTGPDVTGFGWMNFHSGGGFECEVPTRAGSLVQSGSWRYAGSKARVEVYISDADPGWALDNVAGVWQVTRQGFATVALLDRIGALP